MDWFDKLVQWPMLQAAAAFVIAIFGVLSLWRGFLAPRRDSEATVPVGTLYLREMCETLKRIEVLLTPPRRR